jgi:hypothetical protein
MPLATSLVDDLEVSVRDGVQRDKGMETSFVKVGDNNSILEKICRSPSHTAALKSALESSSSVGGVCGAGGHRGHGVA